VIGDVHGDQRRMNGGYIVASINQSPPRFFEAYWLKKYRLLFEVRQLVTMADGVSAANPSMRSPFVGLRL